MANPIECRVVPNGVAELRAALLLGRAMAKSPTIGAPARSGRQPSARAVGHARYRTLTGIVKTVTFRQRFSFQVSAPVQI